jgi:hypothetical protein
MTRQSTYTQPVGAPILSGTINFGATDFVAWEQSQPLSDLSLESWTLNLARSPVFQSSAGYGVATNNIIGQDPALFPPVDLLRSDSRWRRYVDRRLSQLERGEGDFTGLQRPINAVVERARVISNTLFRADTPTPSVVPSEDGNIQFIWHKAGWELEIEVASEEVNVWARCGASGAVFYGSLGELQEWVMGLLELLGTS